MRRILLLVVTVLSLSLPVSAGGEVVMELQNAPRPMSEEHPAYQQCQLGSLCADAQRAWAGSDLALVCLDELGGDLPRGSVTRDDVQQAMHLDRLLALAEITPKALWLILEQSVSRVALDLETELIDEEASQYEGFCQISGMTIRYDVSAPVGERVLEIRLEDGFALSKEDDTTVYTLCASEYLLSGGYGFPEVNHRSLNGTQTEALSRYLSEGNRLSDEAGDRITVVGARQGNILGVLSPEMLFVGCAVLCVFCVLSGRKLRRYQEEY